MANRKRIARIVRNFPENGLKVLLEHPHNVRDLLRILLVALIDRIDFGRMKVEPARFVHRDYRHLESDIVLKAPLLTASGQREVIIYILIEHQSEPDELMVFRALEYVVLIYRRQMQEFQRQHGSLTNFRFQPVLPIVLYTGTRTWERLGNLADLVELGAEFADVTPSLKPLFLNIGAIADRELDERGGGMGGILRLHQLRKARREVFEEQLTHAVTRLEELVEEDRARWLELLSYIHALVYHEREPAEREALQDKVTTAVEQRNREESANMAKTIAEEFIEQGIKVGEEREAVRARQQMLVEQLRAKFKKIPIKVVRKVEATTSVEQLSAWLVEFATAEKLDDMSL